MKKFHLKSLFYSSLFFLIISCNTSNKRLQTQSSPRKNSSEIGLKSFKQNPTKLELALSVKDEKVESSKQSFYSLKNLRRGLAWGLGLYAIYTGVMTAQNFGKALWNGGTLKDVVEVGKVRYSLLLSTLGYERPISQNKFNEVLEEENYTDPWEEKEYSTVKGILSKRKVNLPMRMGNPGNKRSLLSTEITSFMRVSGTDEDDWPAGIETNSVGGFHSFWNTLKTGTSDDSDFCVTYSTSENDIQHVICYGTDNNDEIFKVDSWGSSKYSLAGWTVGPKGVEATAHLLVDSSDPYGSNTLTNDIIINGGGDGSSAGGFLYGTKGYDDFSIACGYIKFARDNNNKNRDCMCIKYGPNGDTIPLARRTDGNDNELCYSADCSGGGFCYAAGSTNSYGYSDHKAFFVGFNMVTTGNGNGDHVSIIKVDNSGPFSAVAMTSNGQPIGVGRDGKKKCFIARLASTGKSLDYYKRWGTDCYAYTIVLDGDGDPLVGGSDEGDGYITKFNGGSGAVTNDDNFSKKFKFTSGSSIRKLSVDLSQGFVYFQGITTDFGTEDNLGNQDIIEGRFDLNTGSLCTGSGSNFVESYNIVQSDKSPDVERKGDSNVKGENVGSGKKLQLGALGDARFETRSLGVSEVGNKILCQVTKAPTAATPPPTNAPTPQTPAPTPIPPAELFKQQVNENINNGFAYFEAFIPVIAVLWSVNLGLVCLKYYKDVGITECVKDDWMGVKKCPKLCCHPICKAFPKKSRI